MIKMMTLDIVVIIGRRHMRKKQRKNIKKYEEKQEKNREMKSERF